MGMVVLPLLTPELLEQMTDAIVQAVAPEQIVLFGSRSKGLDRPDSDIDLYVPLYPTFRRLTKGIMRVAEVSSGQALGPCLGDREPGSPRLGGSVSG